VTVDLCHGEDVLSESSLKFWSRDTSPPTVNPTPSVILGSMSGQEDQSPRQKQGQKKSDRQGGEEKSELAFRLEAQVSGVDKRTVRSCSSE